MDLCDDILAFLRSETVVMSGRLEQRLTFEFPADGPGEYDGLNADGVSGALRVREVHR